MKALFKNIFILGGLILTVALGYYLYVRTPALEDVSNAGDSVELKASRFLSRLNQLKQIQLQSDILSDGRFSSLTNFSGLITPEPVGKTNPFESN